MVKQIHIENYKSVQSLDIELGRLNVFIGANGCGKTNLLEAIALGSAAVADKLDHEFLGSRIRVTETEAMYSGFFASSYKNSMNFLFSDTNRKELELSIELEDEVLPTWKVDFPKLEESFNENEVIKHIDLEKFGNDFIIRENGSSDWRTELLNLIKLASVFKNLKKSLILTLNHDFLESSKLLEFLIFAPENYFLRRFEEESQIKPLGIRGEGLFSHLIELTKEPGIFIKIKEYLQMIDWFDDFEVPDNLMFSQAKITIKDRFIAEGLQYFDQRSANEGFLYLLFYVTLFISPYTPKFFAIDNIDNSLNPKLCSELTKMLAQLAKDHDKQAILTTHNPAVLDGLNLNDDEQRLFVIYRNADGHTKAQRILKKEVPNGMSPVKLSEQFLRGYLGGLNENF